MVLTLGYSFSWLAVARLAFNEEKGGLRREGMLQVEGACETFPEGFRELPR